MRSVIGDVLSRFHHSNKITLEQRVLAHLALADQLGLLKVTAELISDQLDKLEIAGDFDRSQLLTHFSSHVASVLPDSDARSTIQSYFTDGLSEVLRQISESAKHAIEKSVDKDVTIFRNKLSAIYQFSMDVTSVSPKPTLLDIRLAAIWAGHDKIDHFSYQQKNIEGDHGAGLTKSQKWHMGRCLSARLAERVAKQKYREMGNDVRDIASSQLNKEADRSWQLYDLDVDGKKIDVKNSRRSFSSKNTYSEHCVPSFKSDRHHDDVVIAGVLSDYTAYDKLLHDEGSRTNVTFLGETTITNINNLSNYFCRDTKLSLDFSRTSEVGHYFLPPWIFSYPDSLYKQSSNNGDKLKHAILPNSEVAALSSSHYLAPLITSGHPDGMLLLSQHYPFLVNLGEKIVASRNVFGRSLPAVFLCILTDFINVCNSDDRHDEFDPSLYERVIFHGKRTDFPAGIYDPLETVKSLIKCFVTIWAEKKDAVANYTRFRLRGGTILQGRQEYDTGHWDTLLAHCGGRRLIKNVKCGKFPLILGRNDICVECGHLICDEDDCQFCDSQCSRYKRVSNQLKMGTPSF